MGREFLKLRDSKRLLEQTEKGQGAVWRPDLNKGQMSAAVVVMQNLGILDLLAFTELHHEGLDGVFEDDDADQIVLLVRSFNETVGVKFGAA